jgi:hypothetical protein
MPDVPERSWSAVLDALERHADRALAGATMSDLDLPDDLGPIPDSLRDRALDVLRLMSDVEGALAHRRDDVARELTAVRSSRPAGPGMFDATAHTGRVLDRAG